MQAAYEYEQTFVANLDGSKSSFEALAASIGSECAGVIAGAPRDGAPTSSSFARHVGEEKRRDEQVSDLEEELGTELSSVLFARDRQAALAFAAKIRTLIWGDQAVARLLNGYAKELEERFQGQVPNACADMKAWAASGYRTLSAESRALVKEREERSHKAFAEGSWTTSSYAAAIHRLRRYEWRFDKPLALKRAHLGRGTRSALKRFDIFVVRVVRQLNRQLGFHSLLENKRSESPPPASVVFAHRRTAAGNWYEARLEPSIKVPGASGHERLCRRSVVIQDSEGQPDGACVSAGAHQPARQSVNCDEGLLTISAVTLPAARAVSLRFSDGRQITSRVVRVPARLGGRPSDAGIYFQIVRGPSPIPVALAELDAHGKALKVLKLPRIVECKKHALKFLHNGIQTLARGRLPIPGRPTFKIEGEAYRFLGSIHFALKVETEGGEGGEGGGEGLGSSHLKLFDFGIWEGCRPHPYAIVYGLLHDTRDVVLARTPHGLVKLRHASIPKHLHAHGVLVYRALPEVPSALIVRNARGRTLMVESLGRQAQEAREMCEGESEGTGG